MARMNAAAVAATVALCASSQLATAQPATKQECLASYSRAQDLRRIGKLRDAQAQLLVCAREPCPTALREDCSPWLSEVQKLLPTVVLAVRGREGREWVDVTVLFDGEVLARRLDGKAVGVDPGPHVFRFEIPGHAPIEQSIVVREGEKAREIVVAVDDHVVPAPDRAQHEPSAGVPPETIAFASVAVAALGFATFFGATGLARWDRCHEGGCTESDKAFVDGRWVAAELAGAVGIIGASLAAYFYFTRSRSPARDIGVAIAPGALILRGAF